MMQQISPSLTQNVKTDSWITKPFTSCILILAQQLECNTCIWTLKKNAQRDLVVAIIYFSPKRHQLNFFLIVEFFISFGVNSFFFNSLWSLCRESCRSSFNQGGNYWIFQRIVTQWETLTRKSVSFVEGNYKRLIRLLQSQPLDPVKRYCKIIFSGIILLNFTTLLYRIF